MSKRKFDSIDLSIKERKAKWVLSRPNNKNDGFRIPFHDPLNPYISKLRLRPEPNLLSMSDHLIVRKHPISEDQDGFLPPSKKGNPSLTRLICPLPAVPNASSLGTMMVVEQYRIRIPMINLLLT